MLLFSIPFYFNALDQNCTCFDSDVLAADQEESGVPRDSTFGATTPERFFTATLLLLFSDEGFISTLDEDASNLHFMHAKRLY